MVILVAGLMSTPWNATSRGTFHFDSLPLPWISQDLPRLFSVQQAQAPNLPCLGRAIPRMRRFLLAVGIL